MPIEISCTSLNCHQRPPCRPTMPTKTNTTLIHRRCPHPHRQARCRRWCRWRWEVCAQCTSHARAWPRTTPWRRFAGTTRRTPSATPTRSAATVCPALPVASAVFCAAGADALDVNVKTRVQCCERCQHC